MSGAPRVELNNTQTDFDLATPNGTPDLINQMDGSPSHVNGSANSDLQNSAIKAKNGILESEVSGTERPRPLPRRKLTPYIAVLSAARTTPDFLNSHPHSSFTRHERRKQPPQRAERQGDRYER